MQILSAELGSLARDLSFQRSMRWNSSQAFSRPVRWLLGLHGACLLPWAFGGLLAGRTSRGLRTAGDFSAATPQDYLCAFPPPLHHLLLSVTATPCLLAS